MKVGLRELKLNLSRCVEAAHSGVPVEITRHKRTVARLVGVPAVEQEGLAALLASGAAQWNGGKPRLTPPVTLSKAGRSASDMLIEDRG